MTYTNPWSDSYPANTDPASNSASDLRRIRVDMNERMETLLGPGNFESDPVVVLADSYKHFMHWSEFLVFSGASAWSASAPTKYGISPSTNTSYTLYAPVRLPRGAVVTELAIVGYTNTSYGPITATLESIACTASVSQTTHATAVVPASTSQGRFSSGVVAVTIDNTASNYTYYYIKVVMASTGATQLAMQGVELVYTKPNLSHSL